MSNAKKRALEAKLDGRQKTAALACVEREFAETEARRSFDEIAEEAGVARKTLWEWRTQNKAFIDYVNLLADDFLESKRTLVYRQLMRLIDGPQPSVKGIDLYLRRHGLLTERQVVETKDIGGSRDNADIASELAELDELLDGE
ncbi:phBC6A51 family helix-turn-helix protein [Paenibacillus naphthalenovorans]|uniref:phBC6A51 family helix-turn-helix protein n=1 Tax=Paenibacillus naphthalenovorans TaxID=162209 RepID=UPI003D296D6E